MSVLRRMRRYGRILMVSQEEELDPSVEACLKMGERRVFWGLESWMLQVTEDVRRLAGDAGRSPGAGGGPGDEDIETLLSLWEQAQNSLNEMSEADFGGTAIKGWEQKLLGGIAALHTMEDIIISRYSRLDNLDLKVMANWAKGAAMDFYLEIRMGGPNALYFQAKMKETLESFAEAFEEEFYNKEDTEC